VKLKQSQSKLISHRSRLRDTHDGDAHTDSNSFPGRLSSHGYFLRRFGSGEQRKIRGMAMGVIQIGQNVGLLLGPLAFGSVIQFFGGWQMAFWALVPVTALGIVAGWMARMEAA